MGQQEKDNDFPPNFVEQLGFLGAFIATIGDAISTLGAGIALSQANAEIESKSNENGGEAVEQKLIDMQNQIDSLQAEIRESNKADNKNPW